MALTFAITGLKRDVTSTNRLHSGQLAIGGTYTGTTGDAVTPEQFGLHTLESLVVVSGAGFVYTYNKATGRLQAFYADYDAVADGALIQVANSTAITDTTRFVALGT